jgi:protein-S-isoprenylcysteine O-methyltransferase Ste14
LKVKQILPPTYVLIAVISMLVLHFVYPVARPIPLPWDLLGLIPLALGIVLNLIADSAFRKAGTTVKPFQESTTLITNGVFHISRHPMYLGFVFILIGIAMLVGSLTPWLVVPIFILLMELIFIQAEERMLIQKFGQTYRDYKKKVRRWI